MPISLATLSTIALRSLANSLRSATSSSVALPMAFGSGVGLLRERLVNAVLIRPLLSPVAVVTVVGRCQRLPGNPAYREESGKGYGDRGFIEAH